jgi:hypothetical protein
MKTGLLARPVAALTVLAALAAMSHAQTSVTFSASGPSPRTRVVVSAKVVFTILPGLDGNINTGTDNLLQLDITNTQAAARWSYNRTDALNAVLFTISPSVTVNSANGISDVTTSLLVGSSVVNSRDVSTSGTLSQAVNGSWAFGKNIDAERRFDYGVSTAAFANINNSKVQTFPSAIADGKEAYHFTGIGLGTDGDDYSPMPSDVMLNSSDDYLNGGNIAMIKGPVRVTIADTNVTAISQITAAGFAWASGADGATGTYAVITGSSVTVPEPGTAALAIAGCLVTPLYKRRRCKSLRGRSPWS